MAAEPMSPARMRYGADGFFLHSDAVIPTDLVRRAAAGMDALREGRYDTGVPPEPSHWSPGDDRSKLCKIEMPQFANRAIRELVSHPALGALAAEITGARRVQVWWVQLLLKPPTPDGPAGTNVGWHQDRNYWQVWEEGSELFTAWVALSDVTAAAGPMRFVRGSHRWGLVGKSDFYSQDHEAQRGEIPVPASESWEEVPAILPPGGVSFHHCLTFHASGPNLTTEPRRSFAIHMRTDKSNPVNGVRHGLSRYIDDTARCPIIYQQD